ncbi:hypothetical protein [Brevibacterium sp.]|uniref:hypothetical protein n=1 Tax=Brevibacterium sp. TaxID=1701 RepID=UPI0025BBFB78|nr:hypothetical protein [Brevibacterium sp.]
MTETTLEISDLSDTALLDRADALLDDWIAARHAGDAETAERISAERGALYRERDRRHGGEPELTEESIRRGLAQYAKLLPFLGPRARG